MDGSAIDGAPVHGAHDASAGMTGMVLGITIVDPEAAPAPAPEPPAPAPRRLTMVMQSEDGRYGNAPAYGFVLGDTPEGKVSIPGPPLVLERGAPVEITLVNRLPESTSIHWHGMELESYYDGVHGFSGSGQRVTPLIDPGESFVVRFTPPRAGTFMYHTHMHDARQLTSGLYGAMLVVEPGATMDALDHPLVISRGGPALDAPTVLNGEREPALAWKAGATHRIRLLNITPGDIFNVSLRSADGPVTWRPIAKDAIPLPPERCAPVAAVQTIAVGETFDFEVTLPEGRRTLWLEVRTPGGKWHVQGKVNLR